MMRGNHEVKILYIMEQNLFNFCSHNYNATHVNATSYSLNQSNKRKHPLLSTFESSKPNLPLLFVVLNTSHPDEAWIPEHYLAVR